MSGLCSRHRDYDTGCNICNFNRCSEPKNKRQIHCFHHSGKVEISRVEYHVIDICCWCNLIRKELEVHGSYMP